jgi:hypothetical protein
MTGSEEVKVTYPKFFLDGAGELMFTYRDGGSGKGDQIFNRYVPKAKLWTRAMFRPLTDGEGARNAYFDDFQRGADGYLHLCWVWRETSDAATTNTLSHVRTKDFKTWENAKGEKVTLPIRRGAPVEVDPVPQGGGILNTNTKLGFAPNGAPVIAYHKHDANGNTQVHVAGWNGSVWVITPMTEYDYRWEFGGGGTLVGEIGVRRPTTGADGTLSVQWNHKKFGTHRRLIDPTTFAALDEVPALSDGIPKELRQPGSTFPEMQVRFVWDSGTSPDPARKSLLRWETLARPHDAAPLRSARTGVAVTVTSRVPPVLPTHFEECVADLPKAARADGGHEFGKDVAAFEADLLQARDGLGGFARVLHVPCAQVV